MHFESDFGLDNKCGEKIHSRDMLSFTFTFTALTCGFLFTLVFAVGFIVVVFWGFILRVCSCPL